MTRGTDDMKAPRLWTRNGTHYFRIKVPADLRAHYAPKQELKWSLRTTDLRRAKVEVNKASVKVEAEFERLRRVYAGPSRSADGKAASVSMIDDAFVDMVCDSYLSDVLETDVLMRTNLRTRELDREFREEGAQENLATLQHALAHGTTEVVEPMLRAWLHHLQFAVSKSVPGYASLCYAFLQTVTKAAEKLATRDRGADLDRPPMIVGTNGSVEAIRKHHAVTLRNLFDGWKNAATRRAKTAADYEAVVDDFSEFLKSYEGGIHASKVAMAATIWTRDVVQYRDDLRVRRNLHWKTVDKKIGVLKTLFRLAVSDTLLPSNPCEKVVVAADNDPKKPRLPFTVDELNVLFKSPVYTQGLRPKGGRDDAAFWLPLIGLFTGARLEELAQLRVKDVRKDPECGWFFDISDEGDHKTLKTASSRRRVPMHKTLVTLGLARRVEAQRRSGEEWLFPELSEGPYAKRSASWSKWFGRYLRKVAGIDDKTRVFHSFRHSFKEACRSCGIEEALHDALTGHVGSSEGRRYGGEYFPLQPLAGAMRQLKYRGLDLSHVHAPRASGR